MFCTFPETLRKGDRCTRCGFALPFDFDEMPKADCRVPGLGDLVAKGLAAVGVTEPRWLLLKRWAWKTLTGKEVFVTCGCGGRKEKLNRWGRFLKSLLPPPPGE